MKNAVGRELPERVGSYEIHPYEGLGREQAYSGTVRTCRRVQRENSREPKLQKDLVSAIRAAGLPQLCEVLPQNAAEAVWQHFHKQEEEPPCE